MEQRFNGHYAPAIETARGCPFTCGYCVASNSWFKPVIRFSTQRIKDELTYIAHRIHKYPEVVLAIYDTNFGMYKRDVEIAEHLSLLQDEFGWPNSFDVSVGKTNMDQIFHICTLLKNRMPLAASVQTLNPKTLEVIKRKNLPMSKYYEIQNERKKHGFFSQNEFIIPLPEETKESFFNGVSHIIDAGADVIIPYTTMLLKQTPLATREYRKKYCLQNKFRIIPRQFGEYQEEKCFEIEEVCVATNTLSFEDYLDCRGFGFVCAVFFSDQFDIIIRHIKEIKLNYFDYMMKLWDVVKSGNTITSSIYHRFMEEAQQELWESREQIYGYFTQPENYQKLLIGELGDNLVRKYKAQIIIEAEADAFEVVYALLGEFGASLINEKTKQSLQAAKQWVIAVRDSIGVFKNRDLLNSVKILELPFDIMAWYNQKNDLHPLITFDQPASYKIYYDLTKIQNLLDTAENIFGDDVYYQIGKYLAYSSIKNFWRICEPCNTHFKLP